MPSKWCAKCQNIVTCNYVPEYCIWCGNSLQDEDVLPEFRTWQERVALVEKLKKRAELPAKTKDAAQMKLF